MEQKGESEEIPEAPLSRGGTDQSLGPLEFMGWLERMDPCLPTLSQANTSSPVSQAMH